MTCSGNLFDFGILDKEQDPFDTSVPPGGYLDFTIDADLRSRIIQAAEKAVEASHECGDFVDRTEVETEVLAGLLKMIKDQESVRQGLWMDHNGMTIDDMIVYLLCLEQYFKQRAKDNEDPVDAAVAAHHRFTVSRMAEALAEYDLAVRGQ